MENRSRIVILSVLLARRVVVSKDADVSAVMFTKRSLLSKLENGTLTSVCHGAVWKYAGNFWYLGVGGHSDQGIKTPDAVPANKNQATSFHMLKGDVNKKK